MVHRLLLVVVGALLLAGCRLDVTVAVEMEPDGTGIVTVDAVADAELVALVPDVVDDLRLDDAVAAGWVVGEPTSTDDGGLAITLSHSFASAEELANVLNSIGPPLLDMRAARTSDEATEQTTNAVTGRLQLADGYASWADDDLLAAVGGQPYGEEIAAAGLPPEQAVSVTLSVDLPGELVSAETGTEVDDGVIEWQAPLDGTSVDVFVQTVQRPAGSAPGWAGPVATVALVLLVAWVVVAGAFIVFVAVARRNRRRRRERAVAALGRRDARVVR